MPDDNTDVDDFSSAEEIPVDSYLRNLLELSALVELSAIPGTALEYEVPVTNVRPCPACGEGTALVRLGRELRIVDAMYDRANSEPFNRHWSANILRTHDCGARR